MQLSWLPCVSHSPTPAGVPVTRAELSTLIRENFKDLKGGGKSRLPGHIITLAQAKMIATFGMEMRELERLSAGQASQAAGALFPSVDGFL